MYKLKTHFIGCKCNLFSDGEILKFDVIKTKPEDIKDTNGAGDAFVGGLWWGCVNGGVGIRLAMCKWWDGYV